MIVHSARNLLDGTCRVRVEGIDPNEGDGPVMAFAAGAAGRHNCGEHATSLSLVWCDEHGRPLDGEDTEDASVALVVCRITDQDAVE